MQMQMQQVQKKLKRLNYFFRDIYFYEFDAIF